MSTATRLPTAIAGPYANRLAALAALISCGAAPGAATSHSGLASTYLHADGGTDALPRPAAEVDREIAIHGLSVVEVRRGANGYACEKASLYNRRVTPLTPVAACASPRPAIAAVSLFGIRPDLRSIAVAATSPAASTASVTLDTGRGDH